MLREEAPIFKAVTYRENTWRQALSVGTYAPRWGHGYVGFQANGKPIALLVGFVDDFKIHGSDLADCQEGFCAFMDFMIRLGLICQKGNPPPTTDPKVLRIPLQHHWDPNPQDTTPKGVQVSSECGFPNVSSPRRSAFMTEFGHHYGRAPIHRGCYPPTYWANLPEDPL
jgi:hypothetical protein